MSSESPAIPALQDTTDQQGSQLFELFATCSRGFESILAHELKVLGVEKPRPLVSGVSFTATLETAYRACLWLRTASRVLLILDRVAAADSDTLYENIKAIKWEDHIGENATFSIDAQGTNAKLNNSQFVALRVKDAIVDRLREKTGKRPDVERDNPDVIININLREDRARVAIDLVGEPLHRRGYRVQSSAIEAPLRETIAAAMLIAGGVSVKPLLGKENRRTASSMANPTIELIVDPLCGSGTIAIEAAMLATDRAPGLIRDYWGFTGWLGHDEDLWLQLLDEADDRAERGLERVLMATSPLVIASDIDYQAIKVARSSAKKAGVEAAIQFIVNDIIDLRLSDEQRDRQALMVTNPPYGQRLSTSTQLPALYAAISAFIQEHEASIEAVIITPDDQIEGYLNGSLGSAPSFRIATMNGPIQTTIRVWQPERLRNDKAQTGAKQKPSSSNNGGAPSQVDSPKTTEGLTRQPDSSAFGNRLRRISRHRGKWAEHSGVTNYRIYDADLPDFNLAIDIYEGSTASTESGIRWLHVSEYSAPTTIDPNLARARLSEALRIAATTLDISPNNIFLKRRERARGGSQYSQQEQSNASMHVIEEGGLSFGIDLSSRLDTGIFLDHRITRSMLRDMADKQDCLNLFAYTGTASVYMAAGNAKSVTSVDLSNTYLSWAKSNMELNGFSLKQNKNGDKTSPLLLFEQADVLRWVTAKRAALNNKPAEARNDSSTAVNTGPKRYGLIFVDVPTFSNSSRMGERNWDVQRDHVELLISISRLLTKNGKAIFSTNLRNFKPDEEALAKAKVKLKDISASTIPPDFSRNRKVHHCYLVTREA
jgi:23S rRNA (guanine2445-N2)-methyltransferase / 23S rRNA (guanine2069-N7)-methyltransferase